jgi:uncharacterized membrane protein YfcA
VPDFVPDSASFAAVIADPRFPLAVAIAMLAGMVRGLSGFGSALVYMPLMSALYGPLIAAPSMLFVDALTGGAFLLTVWRKALWRDILPLVVSALIVAQFGALVLKYGDPYWLRWIITAVVLAVAALLASGWRYHGRPTLAVTLAVGALSGLLGSAFQIAGPPVILYWLGGSGDAGVLRATFISYFAVLAAGMWVTYAIKGLFTAEATALALMVGPLQIVAQYAGTRLFHLTSERVYRILAYAIIALAALAGMPALDGLLR